MGKRKKGKKKKKTIVPTPRPRVAKAKRAVRSQEEVISTAIKQKAAANIGLRFGEIKKRFKLNTTQKHVAQQDLRQENKRRQS